MKMKISKFIKTVIKVVSSATAIVLAIGALNLTDVVADYGYIAQTQIMDAQMFLYVNGVSEIRSAEIQIGTELCTDVTVQRLSDMKNVNIDTLIMIDNSLSISEKNRGKQKEVLKNIVRNHQEHERFSVVTFAETITSEINFSEDYEGHLKAIENIGYVDQDTYIIDAIYEAVEKIMDERGNNYKRIIIISDGVDDNKTGFTKDELIRLLEKKQCPIYSIASLWKKSEEGVENMFEISRAANSKYFLLDDYENVEEISKQLTDDYKAYALSCTLPEEVMDGGKKQVKAMLKTVNGEIAVETETVMPFVKIDGKQKVSPSPKPVKKTKEPKEKQDMDVLYIKYILIGAGGIMVIGLVSITGSLLLLKKKKKKEASFEYLKEKSNSYISEEEEDRDETILLTRKKQEDEDETVIMWKDNRAVVLKITNVNRPEQVVTRTLMGELTLGRKRVCDLSFDQEKTVSGMHCKLSLENGKVYVEDLGSSNKTWLNHQEVLHREELHSGDQLKMGALELRIDF